MGPPMSLFAAILPKGPAKQTVRHCLELEPDTKQAVLSSSVIAKVHSRAGHSSIGQRYKASDFRPNYFLPSLPST
jgi:hypothetical protein